MKQKLTGLFVLLICALTSFAQTGAISGKVVDATTGEEIYAAAVVVQGINKFATTDFEGNYQITGLAPGKYTVAISVISYNTSEVKDVEVSAGKVTTLNVALQEKITETETIVITATFKQSSEQGRLIQQKNAISIGDGISADIISKSPASNSGDVIKKVSGASIQGGKFAVIRGLNDRYNTAYINGAPLPSTEPDRRAFSFDIIPAAMLDNMVINKTATPDMPGDFSGGIIQITTKDFPEINFYNLSVGTGINTITTFKDFATYEGGKTDFLGLDDGTRKLPEGLTTNPVNSNVTTTPENTGKFNNNYGSAINSAMPNYSFQYSMGMVKRYENNRDRMVSAVFGINYNKSLKFAEVERQFRLPVSIDNQLLDSMQDKIYTSEVLWGAILNLSFKINANNRISIKNLYNVNSEDQTTKRQRVDIQNSVDKRLESYYYIQNNILSSQLSGDHFLPNSKLKIDWVAGVNNIKRLVPDYRIMQYIKTQGTSDTNYTASIGPTPAVDFGGRFFSDLNENLYSGRFDVSRVIFDNPRAQIFKKMDVKIGASLQRREREFSARFLGWTTQLSPLSPKLRLPLEQIFNPENTQSISQGFLLTDQTNPSDKYSASSTLQAAYLLLDNRLARRFRLIWGFRMEFFRQQLHAKDKNSTPVNVDSKFNDFLPSANLVYELSATSNLRASVSRTVSRPEFRELAPFSFFDFNTFTTLIGEPKLQRARIMNYDLRYEIYPKSGGELLSISAFYKHFENPIENIILISGSGSFNSSYQNVPSAVNYGSELEIRKKLSFINSRSGLLNNSSVFGNFAYIISKVDLSDVATATTKNRPLQGQSNYIINAGVSFTDTAHNMNFTASVNRVGRRIAIVGTGNGGLFPDVWENPRTIIDLQISKKWGRSGKFETKLSVSDLLAQPLIFYMDRHQIVDENNKTVTPDITGSNKDGKFDGRTQDVLISRTTFGRSISIGLSYKF